jgi:hypothetical protein
MEHLITDESVVAHRHAGRYLAVGDVEDIPELTGRVEDSEVVHRREQLLDLRNAGDRGEAFTPQCDAERTTQRLAENQEPRPVQRNRGFFISASLASLCTRSS